MLINKKAYIPLVACMILFASCSFYHLQTPETVPVGKIAGGIGMVGITAEGNAVAVPGLWMRSGLAPKFDIGVHTWGLGMKLDGKYGFNRSFGLGAGFAGCFMGAFIYNFEGSLYTGIPAGVIYPYGVLRINMLGISVSADEEIFEDFGSAFTGVVGMRMSLGPLVKLYLEGGAALPVSGEERDPQGIFGFGIGFGQ